MTRSSPFSTTPVRPTGSSQSRSGARAGVPAAGVSRPALSLLISEPWRATLDYLAYRLRPRPADRGDGHPVMLYPGLGADGRLMRPLRDHLRAAGYATEEWGRGRNVGPGDSVDGFIQALSHDVIQRAQVCGRALTLVGWSLGGLYAREVAKRVPRSVRMVITLGTPFSADEDRSHAGVLFSLLNGRGTRLTPAMARRLAEPPPVPTVSIYSRTDGVVPWQHCQHGRNADAVVDDPLHQVRDIEVRSSHLSMPWNRHVQRELREALQRAQALDDHAGAPSAAATAMRWDGRRVRAAW